MEDLRVVIPAYNEEQGLGLTIDALRKACPEAELLVVNDGSTDNTAQIAKEKGVILVNCATNRGYGHALKAGFAHDTGRKANYLAFLDGDNTYPAGRLPEMYTVAKDQGLDLIIGSRLHGKNNRMGFTRKVGNTLFACLVLLCTRRFVSDTASGLRVFRAELAGDFEDLPNGLEFTPAMTTRALRKRYSYLEVPIEYSDRMGESKLRVFKDGFRFLRAIMNEVRKHDPSTVDAHGDLSSSDRPSLATNSLVRHPETRVHLEEDHNALASGPDE